MQKCNNALEIIKKSKTKENDTFLGTLQTSSVAKAPSSYHRIRMKNWSGWCNVDFRLWCLGGDGGGVLSKEREGIETPQATVNSLPMRPRSKWQKYNPFYLIP